ncbi:RNA polymerase sigma factor for flagellar operon FliA [Catenuloplanes nepalensis]|uniref:RNA polymerase sigma factor for flagellar operon FliA n=1 Tax=Catenuloplanes nepalensis TaxID=587533 RepID=A0ABT9MTA0_9ACTN|nr:sigma-70 family RNA polymerase sigma factor [Catenuloplanes nepalensis]MDP9794614.1 RNA polymerase sigma factor for flagellar operon FliA [Catenuloplanes nepalensis]
MSSFTTTLSDREREDMIRANMALVGHLVRDMLGRVPAHVNRDDLTSAGLAALVTAARGFDPDRGIPFHRFAVTRIRGALLDELRGLDWASRSVRSRARQADTGRQALTATLGRTPTPQELAEYLGVPVSEINSTADDVQRAVVLSLQGFTTGSADDMVTESTLGPEDMLVHRERIGYLHNAIEALPERLRIVITRYFLNEEPMAVIAAELNVTESRISQLRAEALTLLKDGLNTHLDPGQVEPSGRPDGCVARRRATYFAQIGDKGTLNSRLSFTNHQGLPTHLAA